MLHEIDGVERIRIKQFPASHAIHAQMIADRGTPASQAHLNDELVGKILWFEKMRDSCEVERSQCNCPRPGQMCPLRFQISYLPSQIATLAITKATVK